MYTHIFYIKLIIHLSGCGINGCPITQMVSEQVKTLANILYKSTQEILQAFQWGLQNHSILFAIKPINVDNFFDSHPLVII